MDSDSPKMLILGRDNVEILKTIEANKERLIADGVNIDHILKVMDDADISAKDGWPDPIPFRRLMEDMCEDYHPQKTVEHWTPGQGAPMKRKQKRTR